MKQQYSQNKIELSFIEQKYQLIEFIKTQSANSKIYTEKFNPLPIKINNQFLAAAIELQIILIKAVKQIILNYLNDADIQNKIRLCNKAHHLIEMASDKKYEIGTLRPDFIIDHKNILRVCEINARFPFNGLFMSNYLANYFNKVNGQATPHTEYLGSNIISTIKQYFSTHKPIRIIKGREKGFDIHLAYDEIRNASAASDIQFITPDKLCLNKASLLADGVKCEQFILELHQDELLDLPKEILHNLINNSNYFNDIRTILIAHDKRLLSVLCDEAIMTKYLTHDEVKILKKHIIYTTSINQSNIDTILTGLGGWVLKKYLSGKGDGMYIGKYSNQKEMTQILTSNTGSYVAQKYIPQKKHSLITDKNGVIQVDEKYLVGMLASFNDSPLGIGFFRAGSGSIVNLSTQDGEILGVYNSNNSE